MIKRCAGLVILLLVVTACDSSAGSESAICPAPVHLVVQVPTSTASASRPVFYALDQPRGNTLLAYDWDGNVTGTVELSGTGPFRVVPSPDGTRLLLSVDTLTNMKKTTVSTGGAIAFSDDNSRVVTVLCENNGSETGRFSVVDWQSDTVLWSIEGGPGTVLTRPGTGDFLISLTHYRPSIDRPGERDAFEDTWIVHRDGSARLVLRDAAPV